MRSFNVFVLMLCILASVNKESVAKPSLLQRVDSIKCRVWVDSVFNSLTEKQRLAQLFIPVVDPTNITTAKVNLKSYVANVGVGGILFSKGSIEQYATLINYAQSVAKVPLMVTLDGEWGLSMRIPGTTRFPYSMSLGAIADEQLLFDYGLEVARQCRRMGIHVNFAPVLDVNSNPSNPVIGYRSFGENPHKVSALGLAYSRGLEAGGVMSVAKHFPGHGDTNVDSHKALPNVDHSIEMMDSVDLFPFKEYIEAGMSGIMVGHLKVPALDATGTPASLSYEMTSSLLKDKMQFDGLIFTDALAMNGATVGGNNCVEALAAGADVCLSPRSLKADIEAVYKAIANGTLKKNEIDRRCRKLLAYKYALGLDNYAPIKTDNLEQDLNAPEAEVVNRRLHESIITCVINENNLLPISDVGQSIAVVNVGDDADNVFADFCSRYAQVDVYSVKTNLSDEFYEKISRYDLVIIGIFNDKKGSRDVFNKLSELDCIIPVFFVNPYKMAMFGHKLGQLPALLLVGENTSLAQEYGAQALFGGIRVSGSLPVNLDGIASAGTGVGLMKTRLGYSKPNSCGVNDSVVATIDSLVNVGLQTGAFPGCQVLIAKDGKVIIDKCYGYLDKVNRQKVSRNTLYDLASVSKVAGLLPGLMKAYDAGLYALDDKVSYYIAGLVGTDKENITVRQLLYHESGLPSTINPYKLLIDTASYTGKLVSYRRRGANTIKIARGVYGNNKARLRKDIVSTHKNEQYPNSVASNLYVGDAAVDTIRRRVYNVEMRSNNDMKYSDLNFVLLMELEEALTGIDHARYVKDEIFDPLGAFRTCYNPMSQFELSQIAPTETDNFLRRQTVHGYVHDELAAFSGGVQGNAGLFSTAGDLAKYCQMLLNKGRYGGRQILSEKTVDLFISDKSPNSRRGLGFDRPDMDDLDKSPTASEVSSATFGHIGFTGTCFWVDPQHELIYVFLCNRINPSRDNRAFSRLNIRPAILSALYQSM